MRVYAVVVAHLCFLPLLVFLFTLCSDDRCNHQRQEEADVVSSLCKACWELQTSGKGKKYTSPTYSFILQYPKTDKSLKN